MWELVGTGKEEEGNVLGIIGRERGKEDSISKLLKDAEII